MHAISRTRPSRFSACNIENLGMGLGTRLTELRITWFTWPLLFTWFIVHTVHMIHMVFCSPVHYPYGSHGSFLLVHMAFADSSPGSLFIWFTWFTWCILPLLFTWFIVHMVHMVHTALLFTWFTVYTANMVHTASSPGSLSTRFI